jgi:beta-1,4-mannosyltransferase
MHIIFNPPTNEENKYIEIMVAPLRKLGFIVHALDDFFSSAKHFQSIELVHLNWFENVDDSSLRSAAKSFARKMAVLSVIRMSRKKLVWTMHNRASHEKRTGWFSRTITRYLIRWSHRIIIHSKKSQEIIAKQYPDAVHKLFYLPHPDFIGIYGPIPENTETCEAPPLRLLFVGAVKPYKNIELLIKVAAEFKDKVQVTIAGKPSSTAYGQAIWEATEDAGNIQLIPEFIPDPELPQLMKQCDLLVLPYDLDSSLNSGTVILAFSYKKTVISPRIGTIEDLDEAKEHVFHYDYQSETEHIEQLKSQVAKAIDMKSKNSQIFNQLGNQVFKHVNKVHNKESVGHQLVALYQELLK